MEGITRIYNRKTKEYEEIRQYGGKKLDVLYNTPHRVLIPFFTGSLFSELNNLRNKLPSSADKIDPFVRENNISTEEFEGQKFYSFSDFFERSIDLKYRPKSRVKGAFLAPADSNVLRYPITEDMKVSVKGITYTLDELTGKKFDIKEYAGGECLIFRLTMSDYHHYHHVDDGRIRKRLRIKGCLHTVSDASRKRAIYKENKRVVNLIKTAHFSDIFYIEVGAMLVGKIVNNNHIRFNAGDEKGMFKLGGSTIVILVKPGKLEVDKDIIRNSAEGIETKVRVREKIGKEKK